MSRALIHLLLPAAVLGLTTGCMSLDFMFLATEQTKQYDLDYSLVPEEQTEIVSFEREDGKTLYGVWLRQEQVSPAMIFFHGNDSNIESQWDRLAYYWGWGRYDVFAVDYAGFGMSDGQPTYEGLRDQDGHATVNYVVETTGQRPEDIPWIGLSLGSFVALNTNDDLPARAILLESAFADAESLVDDSTALDLPTGWFFAHSWDNIAAIRKTEAPILIVHGLDDDFVIPESAPLLYDAAPGPAELWQPEGVGHSDLWEVKPEAYQERAFDWFDRF